MDEGRQILQQVHRAQEDGQAADELIRAYLPFIKSETAKFLKRPPAEGWDDELSIAMIAFHEAIQSYSRLRGAFLKYASVLIRNRLIDYHRRERRHRSVASLDTPVGEEQTPLADSVADQRDHPGEFVEREAVRWEIEELTRQMAEFGVSPGDVADNCPRQERTLEACRRALSRAAAEPEILDEFLRTKRLPLARLAESSAQRKTLERHRKYLAALLLIHTNGYEIIRGHIRQIWKHSPGVTGRREKQEGGTAE